MVIVEKNVIFSHKENQFPNTWWLYRVRDRYIRKLVVKMSTCKVLKNGACVGLILSIGPNNDLSELRRKIEEQLLPNSSFVFSYNGIEVSSKQEQVFKCENISILTAARQNGVLVRALRSISRKISR